MSQTRETQLWRGFQGFCVFLARTIARRDSLNRSRCACVVVEEIFGVGERPNGV